MESYIRRPKELREQEWMNRRHFSKTSRPLNIFLLYRKAVSERAKKCTGGASYPEISKVAGASWKNESSQIRNLFKHYAKLEKKYHKKAFSDYQIYSKRTQSTEASNGKRKGRGDEDQSDCDNDSQYLGYSTRKKKAKIRMKDSNSIKQNDSYSWQHTPYDNLNIPDSEHDRPPYSTNWRYSNSEEDHIQMFANRNLEFDVKDFHEMSQADHTTSSATTYIEPSKDDQNLLLGSVTMMNQHEHFDRGMISPNFLNFDNHGNGFENLASSTSEYIQVEELAEDNLKYTQEGEFCSNLSQNQDWELDDHSAPISYSNFEELFGQINE